VLWPWWGGFGGEEFTGRPPHRGIDVRFV